MKSPLQIKNQFNQIINPFENPLSNSNLLADTFQYFQSPSFDSSEILENDRLIVNIHDNVSFQQIFLLSIYFDAELKVITKEVTTKSKANRIYFRHELGVNEGGAIINLSTGNNRWIRPPDIRS